MCCESVRRRATRVRSTLPACLAFFVLFAGFNNGGTAAENAGNVEAASIAKAAESITVAEIRRHASWLASDTLEGREAGARGGKAAGVYLVEELKKRNIQPAGIDGGYYQYFGNDYRNILAVIPGGDERLRHEYILIGAHYDHVGYGSATNSYGPTGYIHNGADDNASGAAVLLELIDAFSHLGQSPGRSLLFVFWDAEEKGLLGSEHWASHPTVPLTQVKLAFNLDMVGRLRSNSLEVYGVRTAAGLKRLIAEANQNIDLELDFNWSLTSDSDHYSFEKRNIPYLMVHTRKHGEYHRPTDDLDLLNFEGMQRITRLLFNTVHAASVEAELGEFRTQARSESNGTKTRLAQRLAGAPPRLGISWDARIAEEEGVVQVTSVVPGGAANRAGFRVGDRVLSLGQFRREDSPADFAMYVTAAPRRVEAVIERPGEAEPVRLLVELSGAPQRLGISWRTDDAEPGVLTLTRVVPGSAADRAGLKPLHSILRVDGKRFASTEEFLQWTEEAADEIELLVEGRGIVRPVKVALPRRERAASTTAAD